jgi:AcrR family transcriptional regulator
MVKKAPRRTAERILEVTLDLFNRFGEPNVSTTLISAELGISPGNLYYHYPAKDALINALFDRYEKAITDRLATVADVRDVEGAWDFVQALLDLVWDYRFLYRDLNDLLSKNRRLETHFQSVITLKLRALRTLLDSLRQANALRMEPGDVPITASSMAVLLSYWLNFEYTCAPRHAQELHSAQLARSRGTHQVLQVLQPYLTSGQRAPWKQLVSQHTGAGNASVATRATTSETSRPLATAKSLPSTTHQPTH